MAQNEKEGEEMEPIRKGRPQCEDVQALMGAYYCGNLTPDQREWVTSHLSICVQCFNRYAELLEQKIEEEQKHLYIYQRPMAGALTWDLDSERDLPREIATTALRMERERARYAILIKANRTQEKSALILQLRIGAALRRAGKRVRLAMPSADIPLETEGLKDLSQPLYLIVFDAPRFPNFVEFLEELEGTEAIVIASGLKEEWERFSLPVHYISYPLKLDPKERERFDKQLKEEIDEDAAFISRREELKRAYRYVSLLDALGISTPVTLLAKMVGKNRQDILELLNEAKNLIFRVEEDGKPSELVCTKAETLAQQIEEKEFGDEKSLMEGYRSVIEAATPQESTTILKLFHTLILRSRASMAKNLLQEYEERIEKMWSQAPPPEILSWGKIFDEMKLFEKSEQVFRHGLDQDPNNLFLLHAYARMLGRWALAEERIREEKLSEARRRFGQAAELDLRNIYTWQAWGHMEGELGHYAEAEECFDKALGIDLEHVYVLVAYGKVKAEQKDYREAKGWFKEALTIDPNSVYAHTAYGDLLAQMLCYAEAEAHLRKALEIEPESVVILNTWGVMASKRGHWNKAEEHLRKALEVSPENVTTLHALAELQAERQKYEDAERLFRKISDLEEPYLNIMVLVAWGTMEGKRENYQEAEERFTQAQSLAPSNAFVYAAWGEMLLRKGDLERAEERIEKAQDIDRWSPAVRNIWGKLLAAKGDLDKARELFQDTAHRARYLNRIITYNTWADIEAQAGNFKEAEELHRKALSLDPENAYTLRAYAKTLRKAGYPEKAEEQAQKAKALGAPVYYRKG